MIDYFFLFRDDDFLRTKSTTTVPISRALKKSFANLYCLRSIDKNRTGRFVLVIICFVRLCRTLYDVFFRARECSVSCNVDKLIFEKNQLNFV
jgi:hypothetical protein